MSQLPALPRTTRRMRMRESFETQPVTANERQIEASMTGATSGTRPRMAAMLIRAGEALQGRQLAASALPGPDGSIAQSKLVR